MSDSKAKAGILSIATYIPRAYHDADYIASRSETPAEIIRTKLGWYQKNVPGPGDGTVAMGVKAAHKALHNSGLNADETMEVIELLRKIHDRGITIVVVEHVMRVIKELTHRAVVLDWGEVIAEGPYEEVSNDPQVISAYLGEEA